MNKAVLISPQNANNLLVLILANARQACRLALDRDAMHSRYNLDRLYHLISGHSRNIQPK